MARTHRTHAPAAAGLLLLLLGIVTAAAPWPRGEQVPAASQGPPPAGVQQDDDPGILTPAAPHEPRINGPALYGVRPGRPFLYRIPATGDRPVQFAIQGLPAGLTLDPATGIVSGTIADQTPRAHRTTIVAANARGHAERTFSIVVGDTLALTPPMGWNDWYTFYEKPSDALMRRAADIMIQSGMADHGYQYVNIDDAWMGRPRTEDPDEKLPARDERGMINANGRFPDMQALTGYIHGHGLKAGIYTSPGALTCAGFYGSWQHEAQDAARFVEWGFDFLKYDWCSYSETPRPRPAPEMARRQRPYRLMGGILREQPRDIVFNLCQYGMGEVWKWGAEVGGHSWRTTGDLGLEKGERLPGFYSIGFKNAELSEFAGPGRWNDPDYILIGWVGNAHSIEEPPTPTALTRHEQYSYMSMWALMAAPLFYSGDITRLDPFTLNVLNNAEVIAVDQDPLGRQGRILRKTDDEFVLVKPMEDGSIAVGLFNLSDARRDITVTAADLGLSGRQRVRDLWRWKDIGTIADAYTASVGRHGVMLVRMWPAAPPRSGSTRPSASPGSSSSARRYRTPGASASNGSDRT
jgi:alpha-galactosidase